MTSNEVKEMQKFYKVLFIIMCVVSCLVLLVFELYRETAEPVMAYESDNPSVVTDGATLVSAHRSGAGIFPENTLMAFQGCMESEDFKTDIYEFDLHITKDGVLILSHDSSLDRMTNAEEVFGYSGVKVADLTYEEIRTLNFGEGFKAPDGTYPYAGLHGEFIPENLRALSLENALDYLESNGGFGYIIEIKNGGDLGYKATDELYRILTERDMLSKVVVGTFNGEVTKYMDENYPDLIRSASIVEAVFFFLRATFNIPADEDTFKYDALQVPSLAVVLNLASTRVINYAHEHNLAMQYWTINDPYECARIAQNGGDAIMSDYPDMAYAVVHGTYEW
ncbi:MAG: hypothetical protein E7523_01140 [Ruminococcaceae bacterium]|nr:hypothetical protein [Oscillospiraceae bacterium]